MSQWPSGYAWELGKCYNMRIRRRNSGYFFLSFSFFDRNVAESCCSWNWSWDLDFKLWFSLLFSGVISQGGRQSTRASFLSPNKIGHVDWHAQIFTWSLLTVQILQWPLLLGQALQRSSLKRSSFEATPTQTKKKKKKKKKKVGN